MKLPKILNKLKNKKFLMLASIALIGVLAGAGMGALTSGLGININDNEPKEEEIEQAFESDATTVGKPGDTDTDFTPKKLSISTGSKTITAGGSTAVNVSLRDKYGLEAPAISSVTVVVNGSNGFRCSFAIKAGTSGGSCTFSSSSSGSFTLTASSQGLTSGTTTITVNTAPKKEPEPDSDPNPIPNPGNGNGAGNGLGNQNG